MFRTSCSRRLRLVMLRMYRFGETKRGFRVDGYQGVMLLQQGSCLLASTQGSTHSNSVLCRTNFLVDLAATCLPSVDDVWNSGCVTRSLPLNGKHTRSWGPSRVRQSSCRLQTSQQQTTIQKLTRSTGKHEVYVHPDIHGTVGGYGTWKLKPPRCLLPSTLVSC